jgi:hypothetical protein
MRQQPAELELVRAFYPYLLPEGFFNRNIELSCYPAFVAFQQQRDPQSFNRWQQCIRELWRDSPPALIAQALQQLKP